MGNKRNFEEYIFDLCKKASKQLNAVSYLQKSTSKGQKQQLQTPLLPIALAFLFMQVITKNRRDIALMMKNYL